LLTENSRPIQEGDAGYENEHEYRQEKAALLDPVHKIVLKDYFQTQVTVFFLLLSLFFHVPYLFVNHVPSRTSVVLWV
jgi:hypothetical protein